MRTYKFTELSQDAQNLAVNKYLHGWYETHDETDLSYEDVQSILEQNTEDEYFENGKFARGI